MTSEIENGRKVEGAEENDSGDTLRKMAEEREWERDGGRLRRISAETEHGRKMRKAEENDSGETAWERDGRRLRRMSAETENGREVERG